MAANSRLAVAAHIVSVLASRKGECVPSIEIASSVNTNPVVIRRILSALAKGRIVSSEKGKDGGSKLLRCPQDISLWDLSIALGEAKLFAIHSNPKNKNCPISCRMKEALGRAFSTAEHAAKKILSKISVSELLEEVS